MEGRGVGEEEEEEEEEEERTLPSFEVGEVFALDGV